MSKNIVFDSNVVRFTRLWTPSFITTELWLDASDVDTITESGGSVSGLGDKSGNSNDMVGGAGNQPTTGTRTINGLNVLDCDDTDYLEKTSVALPSSGDLAVFIVAKVDSTSSPFDGLFATKGAGGFFILAAKTTPNFTGGLGQAGMAATQPSFTGGPYNGPSIYSLNFDYAGEGEIGGFVDGTSKFTPVSYIGKFTTPNTFRIFAADVSSFNPDGAFAELVMVEDVTEATRQKIEGYLAWKWGLVGNLPIGHPYKNSAPTV
jgi:hypothetical protein